MNLWVEAVSLLLARVFLPYPPFVGVRAWVGRSCTFSAARTTKVDRRIGLVLYRLQRGWLLSSRSRGLSRRSRRRGGLGGLMLYGLQILGIGRGRRCRGRRLAHGHTCLRCLFGGWMLNLECVVLLRQAANADAHEYDHNRQRKSHLFS